MSTEIACRCRAGEDEDGHYIVFCPLHAAAKPALDALETAMEWLDKNEHHDRLTVNDFIDGSGFSAQASAAILAARGPATS